MNRMQELTTLWDRLSETVQESLLTLARAAAGAEPQSLGRSDYLSLRQVAAKLGKRLEAVRNWIEKGELKAVNLGSGKQVRLGVRLEWIAEFERQRLVDPRPARPSRRKFDPPIVEYV